ncbi:hypothetical protein [Phenylobacterium sp.]|uniref:hypothetical protein n=1 Tax=Phenylobacterium sp. TaxID=1871053 RepID=UPI0025D01CBE|nr:hypothetical protein [Phenylobacterium sp.]
MTGKVDIISDPNATDSIVVNGNNGNAPFISVGAGGKHGRVLLMDDNGNPRAVMHGGTGEFQVNGPSSASVVLAQVKATFSTANGFGEVGLWPTEKTTANNDLHQATIHLRGLDGTIRAGGGGHDGTILVLDHAGAARITLSGASGDIAMQNADCAEEFDVPELGGIEPGSVMALADDGGLRLSDAAYDHRVAGVISGIGGYRPGILLDRRETGRRRAPLALLGKVYCKVDAGPGAIAVGDLLTTSSTPGHAMKAADPARAFGAVLGKALAALPAGSGLIPILVTLQ